MKEYLEINGFKCFTEQSFEFDSLTILAGSNGTGKSSVIQTLLLIRTAIENNAPQNSDGVYLLNKKFNDELVSLNSNYELMLGTYINIFNIGNKSNPDIMINMNGFYFQIPFPEENAVENAVNIKLIHNPVKKNNKTSIIKKEFYYLTSERYGPRHSLPLNFTKFDHCGFRGEFTAQVILRNDFFRVNENLLFLNSKNHFLPNQIDLWMDYICPGVSIKVEQLGSMNAMVRLRNGTTNDYFAAPNIGFGISYVLPIVVNGLIAKKDSFYIIENPEAHLHPKGQSNIGYFLGKVANAGIKLVIETHSEHVINGIRRAVLENKNAKTNNLNIYFFYGYNDELSQPNIKKINLDELGNMNAFPRDFFDQLNQDLGEIFRKNQSRNG